MPKVECLIERFKASLLDLGAWPRETNQHLDKNMTEKYL